MNAKTPHPWRDISVIGKPCEYPSAKATPSCIEFLYADGRVVRGLNVMVQSVPAMLLFGKYVVQSGYAQEDAIAWRPAIECKCNWWKPKEGA